MSQKADPADGLHAALTSDGTVVVRGIHPALRRTQGPPLYCTKDEWEAFTATVKDGRLDYDQLPDAE
jgi:hypothetical protein